MADLPEEIEALVTQGRAVKASMIASPIRTDADPGRSCGDCQACRYPSVVRRVAEHRAVFVRRRGEVHPSEVVGPSKLVAVASMVDQEIQRRSG